MLTKCLLQSFILKQGRLGGRLRCDVTKTCVRNRFDRKSIASDGQFSYGHYLCNLSVQSLSRATSCSCISCPPVPLSCSSLHYSALIVVPFLFLGTELRLSFCAVPFRHVDGAVSQRLYPCGWAPFVPMSALGVDVVTPNSSALA